MPKKKGTSKDMQSPTHQVALMEVRPSFEPSFILITIPPLAVVPMS